MVKPGGTETPALLIPASPAPFPPRTSFILPLPSALPPPNEYTYLVAGFAPFTGASASGTVIVAMIAFFLLGKFFNFSGQPPSAALRGESPDLQDSNTTAVSSSSARADSRGRLAQFSRSVVTACLRSQSLKNRRSWRTPATGSAAAPADWRGVARFQPSPLLYRKTRPLRAECAKFPPTRANIHGPAPNRPQIVRFPGLRSIVVSRRPLATGHAAEPQRFASPSRAPASRCS